MNFAKEFQGISGLTTFIAGSALQAKFQIRMLVTKMAMNSNTILCIRMTNR